LEVIMRRLSTLAAVPLIAGFAAAGFAAGDGAVRTGTAAFGDWKSDKPGVQRLIRLEDQPAPFVEKSASNSPEKTQMPAGARPLVPDGFTVQLVAAGIASPRAMRVAPNGDLFVADSKTNTVRVFRIPDGSSKPVENSIFASGLHQPYGIAFFPAGPNPEWVYVGNSDSLVRFPYRNGDLKATGKPEPILEHIPATHHWTRDVVVSADGNSIFFSVGSGSNVALDMGKQPFGGLEKFVKGHPLGATWDTEEKRADVLSLDPNGGNVKIYATGLRNCSGMTVQPATGQLWCVVNERDELGDNVPFEYATHVQEGAFYGWPWYYVGNNQDPRHQGERPDLAGKVTVPDVMIQAHSAPLGIAFYTGDDFPADYKGDAFVTLHGSWNRGVRTGYKVIRLRFKDGKPTGQYDDFMTGFVISDKQVWGRPVGVAVAKDGSLFVSEDGNGTIWRVTHKTPNPA
jgi:glucose/arabinose dehydrogenase